MSLDGKLILITGSAIRVGRALALAVAGMVAFEDRRDVAGGALLGVGTVTFGAGGAYRRERHTPGRAKTNHGCSTDYSC